MGRDERSIGDLFSELTRELTTLVRQEINLAKTEMSDKAGRAGKNVGFIAAGGLVAYIGLQAIVAAIILILIAAGLNAWVSALLVGLVIAGIGGFLAWRGYNKLKTVDPVPRQTVDSLQEDKQWAKGQMG